MRSTIRAITGIVLGIVHGVMVGISLSPQQLREIGDKVWQNESKKSVELLTFWNHHEAFPSLGIGHFIWFPTDCTQIYVQTFPDLLLFFKKKKIALPAWLETASVCPWRTRTEFYAPESKQRLQELRTLLSSTIAVQAEFMLERLRTAIPLIIKAAKRAKRAQVKSHVHALTQSAQGWYALIDYINFKGDGTNVRERYAGYGWGLLQVLEGMDTTHATVQDAFVASACAVLERRVAHAVRKEVEQRWLIGWLQRINTYR